MRYLLFLSSLVALLGLLFLSACNKKQKDATQKDQNGKNLTSDLKNIDFYNYDYILVGSYGGFTGGKKMHRIDANGTIQIVRQMKAQAPTDTLKFYTLSKADNKQLHQQVKESKIAETTLDEPGNMTYFIILGKDKAEYTVKWGKSKDTLPENIKNLHNQLLTYCNKE
jgi:hypothetical protein